MLRLVTPRLRANSIPHSKLSTEGSKVIFHGRAVRIIPCAIGIEPEIFENYLEQDSVQERIRALREQHEGVKIIVGVDRLDYIKGVPQKLHAFQIFLEQHPEWHGKVVLFQIAVPSREKVEEYQELKRNVNELVGKINGRFGKVPSISCSGSQLTLSGRIEFCPVHLKHYSITQEELTALYAVSDACLVTSIRDGQNLVCYEYVACQQENKGVMLLSEFCGAQHILKAGSIIFMPWATDEVAEAIHRALTMDKKEREEKYAKLITQVKKYTRYELLTLSRQSPLGKANGYCSAWWGHQFVEELSRISEAGSTKVHVSQSASSLSRMGAKGGSPATDSGTETVERKSSLANGKKLKVPERVKFERSTTTS